MNFLDNLANFFSNASQQILAAAKQNNIPVIDTFNVPAPANQDVYTLNQYSKDNKEQTTWYQQLQLNNLSTQQYLNIALAAICGMLVIKILK